MGWRDAAFLHWRVPAEALRPLVLEGLAIDTFGGDAWVSAVAFRMVGTRLGPVPLGTADFPELNLRTYVTRDGVPGVWFLQIDAADRTFCVLGRRMGMPYRHARFKLGTDGVRSEPGDGGAPFAATWLPGARPADAALDAFLVERYAAYGRLGGKLVRADVRHDPWPLEAANARLLAAGALPAAVASRQPDLAHTSRGVEVSAARAKKA